MTNKQICKEYFKLHEALSKEKQFNKKVDLNMQMNRFKTKHVVKVRGQEPELDIFINEGVNQKFIGAIRFRYAKKNKNLECKHIGYNYKVN